MKFKLLLTIPIIFFFCTKNNVENEIQENIESVDKIRNYEIFYTSESKKNYF